MFLINSKPTAAFSPATSKPDPKEQQAIVENKRSAKLSLESLNFLNYSGAYRL